MNHSNPTAISGNPSKGKEKLILILIGIIGVAGLVFVLNAKSGKSAFSDAGPAIEQTEIAYGE